MVLAYPYPRLNPLLKTETTVPLIFCEAVPVPLLRPRALAVPLPTDAALPLAELLADEDGADPFKADPEPTA